MWETGGCWVFFVYDIILCIIFWSSPFALHITIELVMYRNSNIKNVDVRTTLFFIFNNSSIISCWAVLFYNIFLFTAIHTSLFTHSSYSSNFGFFPLLLCRRLRLFMFFLVEDDGETWICVMIIMAGWNCLTSTISPKRKKKEAPKNELKETKKHCFCIYFLCV